MVLLPAVTHALCQCLHGNSKGYLCAPLPAVTHSQAAQVFVPSVDAKDRLTLSVSLPVAYPSHCAPDVKLQGPALDGELQAWALQQLAELFTPGTACCP